ncbi:MAG: FtsQ-type POTRA domain-containing protein [Kiritimatiellia bacterium]
MRFDFLTPRKKKSATRKKTSVKSSNRGTSSRSRSKKAGSHSGEMPQWARKLLKIALVFLCVGIFAGAHYYALHMYYRGQGTLFVIEDVAENVIIDTGRAVTPDLVKMFLGITNGVHLFSIDVNDKRDNLLKNRPGIKDITIKRVLPDHMVVTVIERKPVARVGREGEVVDEEGVVFARSSRNTFYLPLICREKVEHKTESPMPGEKLQGMDMAAVMLATSLFRPECNSRIERIDTSSSRYLYLTFDDGREASIAWENMTECTPVSQKKMIQQFDRLISCMETDVGKVHHLWNAQHSDRIYGRPGSIVR